MYLIMDYYDLGQIMIWDVQESKYSHNEKVIQAIMNRFELK